VVRFVQSLVIEDVRSLLVGALGGTYDIGAELGGGGMSRTYMATERALNRKVVVKALAPELLAGVSVERFKREVMLAASLQHPHVVPVLATGDADGLPWFTMPFVDGQSLRQRLSSGPMPVSEAIGILRDVARGLAFAHARGVVHRDIKPDNVLLSEGSATVTDFGIAKAISAARTQSSPGLTGTGMSLGTPSYMSPEQAAGDPDIDHRADLYSFGAMAYEMLTGAPPFAGMSPSRMLAAALSERPRPITEVRADLPAPLAKLVMACLEKQAADRPQQAMDLVRVLDTVLSSGAGSAAPVILTGGRVPVGKALGAWAAASAVVLFVVWAASVSIGLPPWALPGAAGVMFLGIPVIALTWYVQRTAYREFTQTPALTPGGHKAPQGTLHTLAVKASPFMSWRRTLMGGVAAVALFLVGVGGFMVARAYGIGAAGSLIAKGELDQNAKLILADFKSPASDTSLGVTLTEALRADLAQSRLLRVLSRANVRDVLRLMQRPVDAGVDLPLAREVATREGIKAIVDGEVVQLGSGYVVAARLVTTQTGEELGAFRETAANATDLLPAVERLSRALRERIGESYKDIRAAAPLERVTTSNVEALRMYVAGMRAVEERRDLTAAVNYFSEATRLDSGFASAYRKWGVSLGNEGGSQAEIARLLSKAFERRDRLSEAERLLTEASYYTSGPREDLRQATLALEALYNRDTMFFPAANNLAVIYMRQGQWKEAAPLLRRAISIEPNIVTGWLNLIRVEMETDRVSVAESLATASEKTLGPQNGQPLTQHAWVRFASGDYAGADSLIREGFKRFASRPQDIQRFAGSASAYAEAQGRLREAREMRALFDSSRRVQKLPVNALASALQEAERTGLLRGDLAAGRALAVAALKSYPPESFPEADRQYGAWGDALYALGLKDQGRQMLRAVQARYAQSNRLGDGAASALLQGHDALANGAPDDAARVLRTAMTQVGASGAANYRPLLAEAYRKTGKPDSAIAVLEEFVSDRGFVATFNAGPLNRPRAHIDLGELYEAKKQPAKALAQYEQFLGLYRNADPELQPLVRDIRARVERLRAATFKG
jgi:eukaryotic-like serine/threonine-protein kinase